MQGDSADAGCTEPTNVLLLITADVISSCQAEISLDARSTAAGALQKVETNLQFLLDYDSSVTGGTAALENDAGRVAHTMQRGQHQVRSSPEKMTALTLPSAARSMNTFDVGLFNGILMNTISLLATKVSASGLISAVDNAIAWHHHNEQQKAKRTNTALVVTPEPFLLGATIATSSIPKLQGLVVFNTSMRAEQGGTTGAVLNDVQMENVNHHIITNVLQDITRMLNLVDEIKMHATGEVRPKKLTMDLTQSTDGRITRPTVSAGMSPPRKESPASNKGNSKKVADRSKGEGVGVTLENLSAEFDNGELRISSGDGITPSGSGIGKSKESVWDRLDAREKDAKRQIQDNSSNSRARDSSPPKRNATDGDLSPRGDMNSGPSGSNRDDSGSSAWKRLTSMRMMTRVVVRLRRKLLQKKFHRWVVFAQATATAATMAKQMIPFASAPALEKDESVLSLMSADNVTQSEEYLRLEQEKAEKESALQEMTAQFDQMLRRNSLLQEQGQLANWEMKLKLRVLKYVPFVRVLVCML